MLHSLARESKQIPHSFLAQFSHVSSTRSFPLFCIDRQCWPIRTKCTIGTATKTQRAFHWKSVSRRWVVERKEKKSGILQREHMCCSINIIKAVRDRKLDEPDARDLTRTMSLVCVSVCESVWLYMYIFVCVCVNTRTETHTCRHMLEESRRMKNWWERMGGQNPASCDT